MDNARALRARGPYGPHGFESHSRRFNFDPEHARANCLISPVVVAVAISKSSPLNCTAYMFYSALDFRKLIEAFFPKFF